MGVIGLLALVFASPNPAMAFVLIFGCPLWFPLIVACLKASSPGADESPTS